MGGCLSRKKESLNVAAAVPVSVTVTEDEVKIKKKVVEEEKNVKNDVVEEENLVKKEVFVIKHRKSHEMGTPQKNVTLAVEDTNNNTSNEMGAGNKVFIDNNDNNNNMVVRTSSCTKEEVDAILIQCGRLSRSNSSGKVGRKYSGSKRSYDLDQDQEIDHNIDDVDDDIVETDRRQHRQRHRQSGRPSPTSSSQGRRRTPSREREQRSGSRERCNGNGNGRRVSRSPGRRTETNSTSTDSNTNNRPGKKMVSVPATVSSKNEPQTANGVKRISVKRNVGAGAGTASPRSQSPARTNNQQQQPSLSRSSSRKAEQSPYRRNPLSEIDTNSLVYAQATTNNNCKVQPRNKESINGLNQAQLQKPNAETDSKVIIAEGANKVMKASGDETKPQTLTRTRSARRSRDLDINSETLLNPNPSYTALLLEDIHNFHQKTTNTNIPNSFSVPPCVTKANSILEAVADLNSTTSSNLSSAYKTSETKDPFVESEVLVNDDLMEPSFHKYVTVRRGNGNGNGVEDMDGQESSGSNSFVSQQQWGYSYSTTGSSWEPNSADSTDRWSSRDEGEKKEEGRRGFSGQRSNGIGRGRIGSGKNVQRTKIVTAAAST